MKKAWIFLVIAGLATGASAAVGWNNSYVYVWPGADPDIYYDLNGMDQSANFHGADLGDFSVMGSLFLNSQLNAWADGDDYYTSTSFSLYYRVYENGDTPPGWSHSDSTSITSQGGSNWQAYTPGVNIVAGLPAGDYLLDVFAYKIHYWDTAGGGSWEERIWREGVDNQPYTAEFQVIPEPGTLSLLGLGLAGLVRFRRRR
jgi:hypothetical protein